MARIRSIHPGIWTDEAFVTASPSARLLFLGILNECDDQGAFEWKPLQIKMRLAPTDNVQVSDLLAELADADLVCRYSQGSSSFGAVRNFRQWQRPKKPNFVHPMPDNIRAYTGPKHGVNVDSSEPGEDDCGSIPASVEVVPHQLPPSGEKSPQMEEVIGKEDRIKEDSVLRTDAAASLPDARTAYWQGGLETVARITGKPPKSLRSQLGLWAKAAKDDCAMLNAIIADCVEARPGQPIAWITAGITARMKPPDRNAWLDQYARTETPQFDLEATADDLGTYHPN